MLSTRVIPCLLLKGNRLVKTTQFKKPVYIGDPINAVKIFNDKEVDELVFLDIDSSANNNGPNFKLISEIASECFMPVGYGGGISTIEQIEKLFQIGIEKVILNSSLFSNPTLITEAVSIFGSQSIVASIDYKKKWRTKKKSVLIQSGTKDIGISPVEWAIELEKKGVGEIILNSIDLDGTMEGYDYELIKQISSSVHIPIVALGGASSIEDFKKAKLYGASAVAAGSLFVFQKPHRAVLITYPSQQELKDIFND